MTWRTIEKKKGGEERNGKTLNDEKKVYTSHGPPEKGEISPDAVHSTTWGGRKGGKEGR